MTNLRRRSACCGDEELVFLGVAAFLGKSGCDLLFILLSNFLVLSCEKQFREKDHPL